VEAEERARQVLEQASTITGGAVPSLQQHLTRAILDAERETLAKVTKRVRDAIHERQALHRGTPAAVAALEELKGELGL
jgi:hypothetical protein